ncbi:unnamed protein product [Arctogadus glacialis]
MIALRNTDASAAASSRRGAEKDSENTADLYNANVNVYKTPPHTQDTGDGLQQHKPPPARAECRPKPLPVDVTSSLIRPDLEMTRGYGSNDVERDWKSKKRVTMAMLHGLQIAGLPGVCTLACNTVPGTSIWRGRGFSGATSHRRVR